MAGNFGASVYGKLRAAFQAQRIPGARPKIGVGDSRASTPFLPDESLSYPGHNILWSGRQAAAPR